MKLEIGVIEKRTDSQRSMPPTLDGAQKFAADLSHRYRASSVMISRADLALAYQRASDFEQYPEVNLRFTPQFSIRENSIFPTIEREMATSPHDALAAGAPAALYSRIFSRQSRSNPLEATMPHKPRSATADSFAGSASETPLPVERTLRSAEKTAAKETPRSMDPTNPDSGWGTPIASQAVPKPVTLPAAEIKRVTEQVIREIDHRVIARRERMERR